MTTILAGRRGGEVVVAGDGQVSLGQTVMKGGARKVRRLSPGGKDVVCGFAGSTADAFTLLVRLEKKLEAAPGQLARGVGGPVCYCSWDVAAEGGGEGVGYYVGLVYW